MGNPKRVELIIVLSIVFSFAHIPYTTKDKQLQYVLVVCLILRQEINNNSELKQQCLPRPARGRLAKIGHSGSWSSSLEAVAVSK